MSTLSEYRTAANRTSGSAFSRRAVAVSSRATPHLARRLKFGQDSVCVAEYPKSGGTWVASLLSTYLDLPFPRQYLLPVTFPAVLHGHWGPRNVTPRGLHLFRDGRDVLISLLHHAIRESLSGGSDAGNRHKRHLVGLFGKNYSEVDPKLLYLRWFENELVGRPLTGTSWTRYCEIWIERLKETGNETIIPCAYESFVSNPLGELRRTTEGLGYEWSEARAAPSIERYDFNTVTGRQPGEVAENSFHRSGLANGWRAALDEDTLRVFDSACASVSGEISRLVGVDYRSGLG